MSFLENQPITSSGSSALDILNVLDILKNQDLYTERLQTLKDATKTLNEGKWIGATMEQAQTMLESAQAAKELAEGEIKRGWEQLEKDRSSHELKVAQDYSDLQKQRNELRDLRSELEKQQLQYWKTKESQDENHQRLLEFRDEVNKKMAEAEDKYQNYAAKVRQIQAIIN